MALILSIDTSLETAFVCLSKEGAIIASETSEDPKKHGAFLQPAIQKLFSNTGIDIKMIDAVAVANGPGSYTGLRVGLASAKGLCYALGKPLIAINTLEILALSAIKFGGAVTVNVEEYLFCPMIDARRMEVFTALYDCNLKIIIEPKAMILTQGSFEGLLDKQKIIFSGNGSFKLKELLFGSSNAIFLDVGYNILALIELAEKNIFLNLSENLAYCEPFYLKDVHIMEKN